ncbi:MAG: DUF3703 domain-containing protein [Pseudomonadota bacterium]
MEYLIGLVLALGVATFAAGVGFARSRNFYPVMLMVIASYYMLFAVQAGDAGSLVLEAWILCGFLSLAVAGFRWNLWLVVAGLLGHGALDLVHPHWLPASGAPSWWPPFCLAFDVAAAACLAVRLLPPSPPVIAAELSAAEACERRGRPGEAFTHLERAHVLGQRSTLDHVRAHVRMLRWGLRRRDPREACGQLIRILGAATKTTFGLIPAGNTGGSRVSAFRPLPIPQELAAIMAANPPASWPDQVAAAWRAGASGQAV